MIDPFVLLAPILILAVVALLGFAGCTDFSETVPPPADTPTFNPPGGTYATDQSVSIADKTSGAAIFFTTDGSDPATAAGGSTQQFGMPIKVSANTTIKAIATAAGSSNSPEVTATYQIIPTPVAFVNRTENSENLNNDRVSTAPLPTNLTAGNLLAVWIWYNSATQSVSNVTDSLLNVYQRAIAPTHGTGSLAGWQQEIWYAINVKGGPNLTVTAVFSGIFAGQKAISAHEYQGLDQASPLQQTASQTGNIANATCGPVSVAAGKLLFAAAIFKASGSFGPGFIQRSALGNNVTEDQVAPAAGSMNATFANAAQDWIAQLASFK